MSQRETLTSVELRSFEGFLKTEEHTLPLSLCCSSEICSCSHFPLPIIFILFLNFHNTLQFGKYLKGFYCQNNSLWLFPHICLSKQMEAQCLFIAEVQSTELKNMRVGRGNKKLRNLATRFHVCATNILHSKACWMQYIC